MGFRVLLIKIDGKLVGAIHTEFGVTPTETFEEFPESPVCGAVMPGGGYLLYINDQIDPGERGFQRLSLSAKLISCCVNETVMSSDASCWVNGIKLWTVVHDSQHGQDHLKSEGELPEEFQQVRTTLFCTTRRVG